MSVWRSILGVFGGLVLGFIFPASAELVKYLWYPPPEGIDWVKEPKRAEEYINSLPVTAFVILLAGYAAGALVGGWFAALVGGRSKMLHALIVGLLFLLAGVRTQLSYPHPAWFAVLNLLEYLPAALLGGLLAGGWRSIRHPAA